MPHFHRAIIVAGLLAVFTGLANAQAIPLTCTTNATVTPALRGEGYTELTGDITISCSGGTAPAAGAPIPQDTITVFYNTNVTNRLLPTVGDPATNNVSEALLVIDEPGSGLGTYGSSLPPILCTTPLLGCTAMVGAVSGPTLNTAVSSGSTPAPNVYQGVVNGNSVTFNGFPALAPGASGSRIFRITNVRVSAQYLAGGQIGAPVQAAILITGGIALAIQNPALVVGFVSNGLTAGAGSAGTLSQCSSQTKTSVNTLTFTENFGSAFKTRVLAQTSASYAGQINNPIQNIPGAIYNSESGFVLPINGTQVAGLDDYGTRLKASFNDVPSGARIFVSTANVDNNGLPVTAPNPIGGASGNVNVQGFVGYAQLVNGEATSDGNSGALGFLPAVPATDYGPLNGNVPIAEIPIINGTGTAVWEVLNTNPNVIESFKFAVYVTYAANVAQNSPPPGNATVNLSFAAAASSGVAADAASPMPRFTPDAYAARALFAIQSGTAPSLTIAKAHTGNFTQGQSNAVYTVIVSNQGGAGTTSGTVTVTESVPSGLALVSMAGTGWTCPNGGPTCTRSDALAAGAGYPAITVTVNVSVNATSPQINSVSVSGGGSATADASDPTVINVPPPSLVIAETHTGSFVQGQAGLYTLTVSNGTLASPTSGAVTVTETVPAGLTLMSMSGTGWACPGTAANNCTRTDSLAAGASYPVLTVTVNVAANATSPQVNQGTVSGGGSSGASASDVTVILPSRSVTSSDFNGDGRPDVIWQDPITGLAQVWFLGGTQGTSTIGAANLTASNTWRIVGVGDFNQDGHPDVVWQDPITGAAQVWFLGGAPGNVVIGAATLSNGNSWRIMSIADFNGDGQPDVIWQDPITGLAQIWFMGGVQGTTVTGAVNLTASNTWRIVGTGDFNQDGHPDVLWQDPVSGTTQIWYLGGAQGNVVTNAVNLTGSNPWRIAAVADFNLDGHPDVVFQDPVSGASQVWFLSGTQGTTINGTAALSGSNPWRIAGPH